MTDTNVEGTPASGHTQILYHARTSLRLSVIQQHGRHHNHLTCPIRQRYANDYNFRQIVRCKKLLLHVEYTCNIGICIEKTD